jgi:hypothetical protein
MSVSMVDDKVWFDETTKLQQVCNDVAAAWVHFTPSGHQSYSLCSGED